MRRPALLRNMTLTVGIISLLGSCALWGAKRAPEAPANPDLGIKRILLLPLHNQSEWPAAASVIAEAVREVLTRDKRYVVESYAPVGPVGEPAWFLWGRDVSSTAAKQGLRALCEETKTDAALSVGIVSYHQTLEEAPFVGSRSQLDYRSAWATHLSLRATLWSLRAEQIVWRDERSERVYHGRAVGLSPREESAAKTVVRELFQALPARTE